MNARAAFFAPVALWFLVAFLGALLTAAKTWAWTADVPRLSAAVRRRGVAKAFLACLMPLGAGLAWVMHDDETCGHARRVFRALLVDDGPSPPPQVPVVRAWDAAPSCGPCPRRPACDHPPTGCCCA